MDAIEFFRIFPFSPEGIGLGRKAQPAYESLPLRPNVSPARFRDQAKD